MKYFKMLKMINIRSLIAVFFMVVCSNVSFGYEILKDTISDPESRITHTLSYDNKVLIAGITTLECKKVPFISLLDIDGNTLWNTTDFDDYDYGKESYIKDIKVVDREIVVEFVSLTDTARKSGIYYSILSNLKIIVGKLNFQNGQFYWHKEVYNRMVGDVSNDEFYDFFVQNDSSIIIPYLFNNTNQFFLKISLNDGELILKDSLEKKQYHGISLCFDLIGNLYLANHSFRNITKLNISNLKDTIWSKTYSNLTIQDLLIHDGVLIAISENRQVYFIDNGNGDISNVINDKHVNRFEASNVRFKNNDMYIVWTYSNWQNYYASDIQKINITEHISEWYITNSKLGSSNRLAINDLNIDNSGNIYISGVENSKSSYYNYVGEVCIKKYSPDNNFIVFDKKITNDALIKNAFGYGVGIEIINQQPIFTMNLAKFPDEYCCYYPEVIGVDQVNGSSLWKRKYLGEYIHDSYTIDIKRTKSDKMVFLSQVGLYTQLSVYDKNKKLIWKDYFNDRYQTIPYALEVNELEEIAIMSTSGTYIYDINGKLLRKFSSLFDHVPFRSDFISIHNNNMFLKFNKDTILYYYPPYNVDDDPTLLFAETNDSVAYYVNNKSDLFSISQDFVITQLGRIITSDNPTKKALKKGEFIYTLTQGAYYYLNKYDVVNNKTLWNKRFDGFIDNYHIEDICLDSTGNIYVLTQSGYNGYLYKFSKDGEILWKYVYKKPVIENRDDVYFFSNFKMIYDVFRDQINIIGSKLPGNYKIYFQAHDYSFHFVIDAITGKSTLENIFPDKVYYCLAQNSLGEVIISGLENDGECFNVGKLNIYESFPIELPSGLNFENGSNTSYAIPNPFQSIVSITGIKQGAYTIQVIDNYGISIKNLNVHSTENSLSINLSDISNGIYILTLKNKIGDSYYHKVVKL